MPSAPPPRCAAIHRACRDAAGGHRQTPARRPVQPPAAGPRAEPANAAAGRRRAAGLGLAGAGAGLAAAAHPPGGGDRHHPEHECGGSAPGRAGRWRAGPGPGTGRAAAGPAGGHQAGAAPGTRQPALRVAAGLGHLHRQPQLSAHPAAGGLCPPGRAARHAGRDRRPHGLVGQQRGGQRPAQRHRHRPPVAGPAVHRVCHRRP